MRLKAGTHKARDRMRKRLSGVPYIGFDNKTIEQQPNVSVGDMVICDKCSDLHELLPPDNWEKGNPEPILTFCRCNKETYVGSVQGKLIVGLKPDVRGKL